MSDTIYVVIGHTSYYEDGNELVKAFDDEEKANDLADDPDRANEEADRGWPMFSVSEVEYECG